jgi:hypothetical protein
MASTSIIQSSAGLSAINEQRARVETERQVLVAKYPIVLDCKTSYLNQ